MPIQLPSPLSTAQGKTDSGSSLSVSFTVKAGVERLLVVSVAGAQAGGASITGATWNGQAMTLAGSYTTPDSNNRKHYGFYLLLGDGGSDTTANIVVSGSGADYIGLAACQYNGVQQTGQPDVTVVTEQSANGGGSDVTKTTTIVTSTEHAWVIGLESGYNDGGPPVAGASTVRRVYETTYGTCGVFDTGSGVSPAGNRDLVTSRTLTLYRVSHILIAFKPGTLPPPIRLYKNGVEQFSGDQGDGGAFRAAVAEVAATGVGGSVLVELGSASVLRLDFTSRWTVPANPLGQRLTLGLKTSVLDAVKPSGAGPFIPGTDDVSDWLTIRYTTANTAAMMQAAIGAHSYYWQGVAIDYGSGAGNVVLVTTPQDTLSYDTPEMDGYLPSQQPADWTFDRCLELPHLFATGSFQFIVHNGKAITFVDHYAAQMYSTGGQGDGFAMMGHVGDGPWVLRRIYQHDVGGESWGFGSHAQRSGAGVDFVGDPGFQAFADADHQPLNQGLTISASRVTRDLANRRYFFCKDTLTIGTGSKTFTGLQGQVFVNGEAITALEAGATATMSGTVTSYNSGTGQLVVNMTGTTGSGTFSDWQVRRTALTKAYKTLCELFYGQDYLIEGVDFSHMWHDSGQINYALTIKLSCMGLLSLNHVATRRITVRYCVFRSVSQIFSLARYIADNSNPAISDITFEHNLCFDVGVPKWGGTSTGGVIHLGTDMPPNVAIRNSLFEVTADSLQEWITVGDSGSGHYARAVMTGLDLRSNVVILSGIHPYREVFGYFGLGPTAIIDPGHFLESGCSSPLCSHNSIVTGVEGADWRSFASAQTFYDGPSGRATLLAKLRNPTTANHADRDYRYLEGQEEPGHDGQPRGPNWYGMYQAMGWAWPFSWVPEAPPASLRQPNPVHVVRRLWPRQAPRPVRAR